MKIKLQEYSLISNEWIVKKKREIIEEKRKHSIDSYDWIIADAKLYVLECVEEQLKPSEKLVSVSVDKGIEIAFDSVNAETDKELFILSEIEI